MDVDAAGPKGSVFVVDGQRVYRRDVGGRVRPVVGSGARGACGDRGPALKACLNPAAVAYDAAAKALYLSTYDPASIRRVDEDGRITTLTTDVGAPHALAPDHRGGVYFADFGRRPGMFGVVRHIDAEGDVDTVAGRLGCAWRRLDPVRPPVGDGGPATGACLTPRALVVGLDGTLYIADDPAARVRAVDAHGTIRTVAGNGLAPAGQISACPSDGPVGCLGYPKKLALAPDGAVYVAANAAGGEGDNYFEHGAIYRIGPGPGAVRVTGRPIQGPTGHVCVAADRSPAALSCHGFVEGLVVDDFGRILFTSTASRPWTGELSLNVLTPGGTGLV